MNYASRRCLVAVLAYCGAAVLLNVVSGQSATNDEVTDISKLMDAVAKLKAELAQVEGQLAASVNESTNAKGTLTLCKAPFTRYNLLSNRLSPGLTTG